MSLSAPIECSRRTACNLIDWSHFTFLEALMQPRNLMRFPWFFSLLLSSQVDEERGWSIMIPALPHQLDKRGTGLWFQALLAPAPLPATLSSPTPCHLTPQSTAPLSSEMYSYSVTPTKSVQRVKGEGDSWWLTGAYSKGVQVHKTGSFFTNCVVNLGLIINFCLWGLLSGRSMGDRLKSGRVLSASTNYNPIFVIQ